MTRTETTLIIEIREEKKITEKLLFFSCCWRTVDRNYGDADIEPTSTGGLVRQLTGFVFGCLNKFKTTFVCVFFFFLASTNFLWIKTLKESLLSVTSERRTSVPSDSVCVSVCLVQGVCGRESLVLGRVSMRFRTSPATPHRLGLCQRSVDFKHIFFFFLLPSLVTIYFVFGKKKHS